MDLRQQSVFHFHLTATKTGLYFHQKLSSWDSPAACGGAGPGEESQDRLRHFRRLSPNSFGVCHMPGRSKKNQCLRAQSRCSGLRAERSLTYWWLVVGRQVRNSCGCPHARRHAAKTGAGVALEAQLRGLKVACVEQDRNQIREYVLPCCAHGAARACQEDFASGTSSKSTKLLWAGSSRAAPRRLQKASGFGDATQVVFSYIMEQLRVAPCHGREVFANHAHLPSWGMLSTQAAQEWYYCNGRHTLCASQQHEQPRFAIPCEGPGETILAIFFAESSGSME